MGEEPTDAGVTPEELAYYRAVEDHFARLRGTRFLFSPKDFSLLRGWWRGGVPLAALLSGITEVMERRMAEGGDPVSSLSYCRHAVNRHAKRLAAPGATAADIRAVDVGAALAALGERLAAAARRWPGDHPLAGELGRLAAAVLSLPSEADPAAVEDALGRLEIGLLSGVTAALPQDLAGRLDESVSSVLEGLAVEDAARRRTERAVRLKCLRELLSLPRLTLDADAP